MSDLRAFIAIRNALMRSGRDYLRRCRGVLPERVKTDAEVEDESLMPPGTLAVLREQYAMREPL